MIKALVLLSGGLDSVLAARVLMDQGIEVVGLCFKSYFFNSEQAKKSALALGIELVEADFSDEHLAMVKNPKYGYGKNMNPCVDCHALMLKKAKEIMGKSRYDFVATGEVLGQRPMSQNRQALKTVEKAAGMEGKLLRPLSAKLLDETEIEKSGKAEREKLFDISGRSRNAQMRMAEKYGIKEYASPGGGCILADSEFGAKLLKMFEYWPDCGGHDVELLKCGRVFWFKNQRGSDILFVIGRNQKDNERLEKFAKRDDIMIELAEENGPASLIRGMENKPRIMDKMPEINVPEKLEISGLKMGENKSEAEIFAAVMALTGYYSVKARGKKMKFIIK
ncbi:MAG: tRNA 4-thiouridine(8) synthase ThiI [bacterium]